MTSPEAWAPLSTWQLVPRVGWKRRQSSSWHLQEVKTGLDSWERKERAGPGALDPSLVGLGDYALTRWDESAGALPTSPHSGCEEGPGPAIPSFLLWKAQVPTQGAWELVFTQE